MQPWLGPRQTKGNHSHRIALKWWCLCVLGHLYRTAYQNAFLQSLWSDRMRPWTVKEGPTGVMKLWYPQKAASMNGKEWRRDVSDERVRLSNSCWRIGNCLIEQLTSKSVLFYMYAVASPEDRSLAWKACQGIQAQTSSDVPMWNLELLRPCFAFSLPFWDANIYSYHAVPSLLCVSTYPIHPGVLIRSNLAAGWHRFTNGDKFVARMK